MNTEKSISQLTTTELLKLIQQANTVQTKELKEELSSSIQAITATVSETSDKICRLENRVELLDQKLRRNNIVIFGLQIKNQDNLLEETLAELKRLLNFELTSGDINNIYLVDKNKEKSPIILEFISLLKKQLLFKLLHKLKSTGVSIANDLSYEGRKIQKELVRHLKQARQQNLPARIKGTRLEVSNRLYTIEELNSIEPGNFEDSSDDESAEDVGTPVTQHTQADKHQKRKRAKLQYSPKLRSQRIAAKK
nr:unnamed protein product [Callosobruchus chinensis]